MKRFPAFTIIELCMVMLLTAIVTGIAFLALQLFQSSTRHFKTDAQALDDLLVLHRLMAQDTWHANRLRYQDNGLRMEGQKGLIEYRFSPFVVVREHAMRIDSFHFEFTKPKFRFRQQEILLPDLLVDEFSFELVHKKEVHPFLFHKHYSAADLMQETSNNP